MRRVLTGLLQCKQNSCTISDKYRPFNFRRFDPFHPILKDRVRVTAHIHSPSRTSCVWNGEERQWVMGAEQDRINNAISVWSDTSHFGLSPLSLSPIPLQLTSTPHRSPLRSNKLSLVLEEKRSNRNNTDTRRRIEDRAERYCWSRYAIQFSFSLSRKFRTIKRPLLCPFGSLIDELGVDARCCGLCRCVE